jgi:hypothetical protein
VISLGHSTAGIHLNGLFGLSQVHVANCALDYDSTGIRVATRKGPAVAVRRFRFGFLFADGFFLYGTDLILVINDGLVAPCL